MVIYAIHAGKGVRGIRGVAGYLSLMRANPARPVARLVPVLGLLALLTACDAPMRGTEIERPSPAPPLALTGADGTRFDLADRQGEVVLLFFGYTHCPDVCPTVLADWARAKRLLGARAAGVRFVFVSVDPERDTPEVIARYVAHFDPALVGATGPRPEMERFTAGLGLAQVRNPGVGDEYTVDHSTAFVLVNPDGKLAGYFQAPHSADALVADLSALPRK